MTNQQISTDLLYEFLADPNKLQPIKQTAQIINNDNVDSENNESFIVDYNNNINNNSPKLNFNSDKNKYSYSYNNDDKDNNNDIRISTSSKRHSSRLSNRDRSISSTKKTNLQNILNQNINMSINSITSDNIGKPPIINDIRLSPRPKEQKEQKEVENKIHNNLHTKYVNENSIAYKKELKFKKMETFAKLIHLKNMNIELTKKYTMDSDLEEMEAELKYHSDIQSKKNGVQLAKSFMCNAITGMEFLNEKYDPFGFKLKGWSDQVKINKDDFDEVFGELLEKYKGNGKKLEPELKLMMMLMISAGTFHMAQSMTSNLPGLDDVIKNNPQLMAKLQSNINKSISGPSELDKKKELYENVKKLHEEKVQKQNKPQPPQPPQNKSQNKPQQTQNKPISVKNLLQDIKSSIPQKSIIDSNSNSITMGDTVYSDSETGVDKPSISTSVKTKSRLANRKNIQFSNT